MDGGQGYDIPAGLERVRRQFERWRRTHPIRSRIPDSLPRRRRPRSGVFTELVGRYDSITNRSRNGSSVSVRCGPYCRTC
jgi:hypothetical protein